MTKKREKEKKERHHDDLRADVTCRKKARLVMLKYAAYATSYIKMYI